LQKDLTDAMNDLTEAHVIINALMEERWTLQDNFAIFNIQIKGLNSLKKSLEEDLKL
jgi:hypothetical protein